MTRALRISLVGIGALAVAFGGFAAAHAGSSREASGSPATVQSTSVIVPAAKPNRYVKVEFSVSCGPGQTAVGGGYRSSGFVWMVGSFPASSGTWTVVLANGRTRKAPATVYAVCLRLDDSVPGSTAATTTGGTTTTGSTTTGGATTTTSGGTYTYPY
jgi:hypothetical protein